MVSCAHIPHTKAVKMLTNTLKNYLRQVAKTQEPNKFFLRWGGVCLRNCGENGDLVTFKNVKEFKTSQKRMWLYLPLLLFRENGDLFPIFQCPECPAMDMIEGGIFPGTPGLLGHRLSNF